VVQRRTISIPDELDARLERLQDRINVSRVCAAALEKEIAMLEATPVGADPEVQRLLRRLQTVKERWYDRGRRDGRQWAIDLATREQLRWFADYLAKLDGATIGALAHDHLRVNLGPPRQIVRHPSPHSSATRAVRVFPKSFPVEASLQRWKAEDERAAAEEPTADRPQPVAAERGKAREIDEPAYWSGWRDAAREIWKAVALSLA
jgi:hypothetical protein